jgi:formylglycine-generating enzyme required for sulfatase activity
LDKTYAFVPSGNTYIGENKQSVQSFYISKTEITNSEYQEFLLDLKTNGEKEKLKLCQIDSLKWNSPNSSHDAYVTHYHRHQAYASYPVINISHEAAKAYCQWLNEMCDKQFGVKDRFKFRLMEKAEYVRAARSDSQFSYSWKNYSLRNAQGQVMCNFTQLGSEDIHRNSDNGNYEIIIADRDFNAAFGDVLAPSKSYWPNEFGIYNLNGNAAEMIAEKGVAMGGSWKNTGYDVRVESEQNYTEPNPWTGFRVVMTYVPSTN